MNSTLEIDAGKHFRSLPLEDRLKLARAEVNKKTLAHEVWQIFIDDPETQVKRLAIKRAYLFYDKIDGDMVADWINFSSGCTDSTIYLLITHPCVKILRKLVDRPEENIRRIAYNVYVDNYDNNIIDKGCNESIYIFRKLLEDDCLPEDSDAKKFAYSHARNNQ